MNNTGGDRGRPPLLTTVEEETTVRAVPMVGPPYLRRGAQVCGRSVGRTCIFLLITFGLASSMIGVVLFTADLQMITGFWAVGIVLLIIGGVLMAVFFTLCCSARRTFNALPADHPDRAKHYCPVPVPSRSSSTYQLLPMRQGATPHSPSAPPSHALRYSTTPRPHSVGYRTSPKGLEAMGTPSPGGQSVGYATSPRGHTTVGYAATPRGQAGGYPTPTGLSHGYSTLPTGRSALYPAAPGGRGGHLLPRGRPYPDPGYSTLPVAPSLGYTTPARDHILGYPPQTQVYNSQVSRSATHTPEPRVVRVSPRAYTEDPPPYSSLILQNDSYGQ